LLKENPLKMPEFLKYKYFFNEKSPSYNLIPEKDDFLNGKSLLQYNSGITQNSMLAFHLNIIMKTDNIQLFVDYFWL
jgi:hypothetical protein